MYIATYDFSLQGRINSLRPGTEYWVCPSKDDMTTSFATAQSWMRSGYMCYREIR